jgi:hypothetical protein
LSTSDIVAYVDESNEPSKYHMEDHQQADEQRVMQTQANYNLSSLNYTKSKPTAVQEDSEAESETDIFDKSKCKCEEISRNPKNKTKVCAIL